MFHIYWKFLISCKYLTYKATLNILFFEVFVTFFLEEQKPYSMSH